MSLKKRFKNAGARLELVEREEARPAEADGGNGSSRAALNDRSSGLKASIHRRMCSERPGSGIRTMCVRLLPP